MPGVLLRIVGVSTGEPHELDGRYVVEYDPKIGETFTSGGWCRLETTADKTKAKVFADIDEGLRCWQQESGIRADGKPNRPLTAFTVTFEPAPEKEKQSE